MSSQSCPQANMFSPTVTSTNFFHVCSYLEPYTHDPNNAAGKGSALLQSLSSNIQKPDLGIFGYMYVIPQIANIK